MPRLAWDLGHATPAEMESTALGIVRARGQRQQAISDIWIADVRLRRALGDPLGRGGSEMPEGK